MFRLSGGVLRVCSPLSEGQSYRVWSYALFPSPAVLASSKPQYPTAARRYLAVDGRLFPGFADPGRENGVRELFSSPARDSPTATRSASTCIFRCNRSFAGYASFHRAARRIVGSPDNPYAAVLALESWFRHRGGFVYDEQPPRADGALLVAFVTKTKVRYCQHYAGAMALMLRMLGIPARVAVGFTSGRLDDGKWIVTDYEAHAWVEVWLAGQG